VRIILCILSVIKVEPRADHQIYVEFDTNECGALNMQPYLNFGVFKKISDLSAFSKVRVSFDTVEWGNSIDLDPQFVCEKCVKERARSKNVTSVH
jgi:hypothetical protein